MKREEVSEEEQRKREKADRRRHPEDYPDPDLGPDDGPLTLEEYKQAIREWARTQPSPHR